MVFPTGIMSHVRTSLFLALAGIISITNASHDRFQHWQSKYATKFSTILESNCSAEYMAYLSSSDSSFGSPTCGATVSCLLSNTDERTKAVLSSASVMLGLIPVVLTLVGPSSAECALLSVRRPILAFLLAVGSPSKNPTRTVEYRGPMEEIIKERHGKLRFHHDLSRGANISIAVAELILGVGAVVNVVYLCWDVARTTVFNPWCEQSWGPLVWAWVSAAIFLLGTGAFSLVVHKHSEIEGRQSWIQVMWIKLKNELVPCKAQTPLRLGWKHESFAFVFISWTTTILTILHIMFGTFWFSSLLFVSASDALGITGRFMVSAVVCRLVLKYELAGMRETTIFMEETEDGEDMKHELAGIQGGISSMGNRNDGAKSSSVDRMIHV